MPTMTEEPDFFDVVEESGRIDQTIEDGMFKAMWSILGLGEFESTEHCLQSMKKAAEIYLTEQGFKDPVVTIWQDNDGFYNTEVSWEPEAKWNSSQSS